MLLKHSLITSDGYGKLVTKLIVLRALKNNKASGYDKIVYLYTCINLTLIIISNFLHLPERRKHVQEICFVYNCFQDVSKLGFFENHSVRKI